MVSTHSRPKAAGIAKCNGNPLEKGFNTQPPEGGWRQETLMWVISRRFQHTAARRRLVSSPLPLLLDESVSTHSRPKAAGAGVRLVQAYQRVSTHSRPKAAGLMQLFSKHKNAVSTHSRPKAAGCARIDWAEEHGCFNTQPPEGGWRRVAVRNGFLLCFNTQPPEGGWFTFQSEDSGQTEFQHTAARRRLGTIYQRLPRLAYCFNTQPPEGGWSSALWRNWANSLFQHTAARRRLGLILLRQLFPLGFNTQPPEGGWSLSQKPCSIRFRSPNFAKLSRKA